MPTSTLTNHQDSTGGCQPQSKQLEILFENPRWLPWLLAAAAPIEVSLAAADRSWQQQNTTQCDKGPIFCVFLRLIFQKPQSSTPQRGLPANPEMASATSNGVQMHLEDCWLYVSRLFAIRMGHVEQQPKGCFSLHLTSSVSNVKAYPTIGATSTSVRQTGKAPAQSVALAVRSPSSLSTAAAWPLTKRPTWRVPRVWMLLGRPNANLQILCIGQEVPAQSCLFEPNTVQSLCLMVVVQSRDSSSSNGGISLLCAT